MITIKESVELLFKIKKLTIRHEHLSSICRRGEIISKIIGKMWFIDEDSLLNYEFKKQGRPVKNDK